MPEHYPDYPHHTEMHDVAARLRRRVRAARPDQLPHPRRARRARPDGGWAITDRRSDPTTRCWSATATTGTRATRTSPALRRRDDPLAPLHRPDRSARPPRQARARRRHRQQRGRHRQRAVPQGRGRGGLHLHALRRLGDAPSTSSGSRPTRSSRPTRASRWLAAPPRRDRCRGSSPGAWRTSGCRSPTTASSTRTRPSSSELLLRLGSGDAWPSPTSPSCSATACASPTAASRGSTRSSTRRATTSASRSSTTASSPRRGNLLPLFKRMFKPGLDDLVLHRPRPADPDDLPVRRAAVQAARALGSPATGRCPGRRDGARDQADEAPSTRTSQAAPHDAVDATVYEHEMDRGCCPPGASARSAAWPSRSPAGRGPRTSRMPPPDAFPAAPERRGPTHGDRRRRVWLASVWGERSG